MRLLVLSHKLCWPSSDAPTGHATDGGFPLQMRALSELFDETTLMLPCSTTPATADLMPLAGNALTVKPLPELRGRGPARRLRLLPWMLATRATRRAAIEAADAVHAAIPGDVGTIGMRMAHRRGKRLFVRHCGNWANQRTVAERHWRRWLERHASDTTVVWATGAGKAPPSSINPHIEWIFATSLTERDLEELARTPRELEPNRLRLVTVGRQEPAKGAAAAIHALARLRRDVPAATLDVIGQGSALPHLEELRSELGLEDAVTIHGRIAHADVLKHLQAATVFVFPSTSSEGFPKAVLEALATGLPVVATAFPVLGQVLSSGGGILLEQPEPAAIAQAVAEITGSEERYGQHAQAAKDAAAAFSLERWRDQIGARLENAWGPLRTNREA